MPTIWQPKEEEDNQEKEVKDAYTSDGKITPRALLGRLRCLSLQEEEKKNKEKKMLEMTTKLAVK